MKSNHTSSGDSSTPKKHSIWKEGPPLYAHLILIGAILAVIGCFFLVAQKNVQEPSPNASSDNSAETENAAAGGFEAVDPEEIPPDAILPSGESDASSSQELNTRISLEQGDAPSGQILENLQQQLNARMEELQEMHGGTWAVYVQNLTTGAYCSSGSAPMPAASLIKLYIMGCVYEDYDALARQLGSEALKSQLSSMIASSDNQAANDLLAVLGDGDFAAGMEKVNAFCQAKGYTDTHMGRLLGENSTEDDNITSVLDCGHFLSDLYNNSENLQYPEVMFHHLKEQTVQDKIPSGIPVGTAKTANKTGELPGVENDAAIIYEAPRNDYIMCIMTQDLKDTEDLYASIGELSNQIYGYFNQ